MTESSERAKPPPARHPPASNFLDLTNRKFGRLRAEYFAGDGRWVCTCVCGGWACLPSKRLLEAPNEVSCGCRARELAAAASTTHGQRGSRTYSIWCGMLSRCRNPKCRDWPDYGGRGITVCERWLKFEAFLQDMGEAPDGMTLDRRENAKGYEPGNCRWATPKQQSRNRRSTKLVTLGGVRQSCAAWDEQLGLKPGTTAKRLRRGQIHDEHQKPS